MLGAGKKVEAGVVGRSQVRSCRRASCASAPPLGCPSIRRRCWCRRFSVDSAAPDRCRAGLRTAGHRIARRGVCEREVCHGRRTAGVRRGAAFIDRAAPAAGDVSDHAVEDQPVLLVGVEAVVEEGAKEPCRLTTNRRHTRSSPSARIGLMLQPGSRVTKRRQTGPGNGTFAYTDPTRSTGLARVLISASACSRKCHSSARQILLLAGPRYRAPSASRRWRRRPRANSLRGRRRPPGHVVGSA